MHVLYGVHAGQVFSLTALLRDRELAAEYRQGSMVLSRLCPVDYHRYHFPATGVCTAPTVINGVLFSVNPYALRRNIHLMVQNKRALSVLDSPLYGRILMLEVGATNVGSLRYTYDAGPVQRGQEKGENSCARSSERSEGMLVQLAHTQMRGCHASILLAVVYTATYRFLGCGLAHGCCCLCYQ